MSSQKIISTAGLSAAEAKEILQRALIIAEAEKNSIPGDTTPIETRILHIQGLIEEIDEVGEALEDLVTFLINSGLTDLL